MRFSSPSRPSQAQIFTQPHEIPADLRGGVIAIGNFDGVHCGHQAVIQKAKETAQKLGVALGVMVFEPHPVRLFNPDAPPFRLTTIAKRARLLAEYGADFTLALPFTPEIAQLSATDFMDQILIAGLNVRHIVVGADFHFGAQRSGSAMSLQEHGKLHGFSTEIIAAEMIPDRAIAFSSSDIRKALMAGDIGNATQWLGHAWSIDGPVMTGDQRGRTINFPTANIELSDYIRPAFGVYAITAQIMDGALAGQEFKGVANIGMRPTVGTEAPRLEAHLFDFDHDIYGQYVEVSLHQFMRPEQKFADFDALREQIARDAQDARAFLSHFIAQ